MTLSEVQIEAESEKIGLTVNTETTKYMQWNEEEMK